MYRFLCCKLLAFSCCCLMRQSVLLFAIVCFSHYLLVIARPTYRDFWLGCSPFSGPARWSCVTVGTPPGYHIVNLQIVCGPKNPATKGYTSTPRVQNTHLVCRRHRRCRRSSASFGVVSHDSCAFGNEEGSLVLLLCAVFLLVCAVCCEGNKKQYPRGDCLFFFFLGGVLSSNCSQPPSPLV